MSWKLNLSLLWLVPLFLKILSKSFFQVIPNNNLSKMGMGQFFCTSSRQLLPWKIGGSFTRTKSNLMEPLQKILVKHHRDKVFSSVSSSCNYISKHLKKKQHLECLKNRLKESFHEKNPIETLTQTSWVGPPPCPTLPLCKPPIWAFFHQAEVWKLQIFPPLQTKCLVP